MGRGTAVATRARAILRSWDLQRQVSTRGNVLQNLLNVDWSGVLARDVLSQSPRAHVSVRSLIGCNTISVPLLVDSYEPDLLKTTVALLQDGHGHSRLDNSLHEPIHCCANFGWRRVAESLLAAGMRANNPGENNMLPAQSARARGWSDFAARLEASAFETDSQSSCHKFVDAIGFIERDQVPTSEYFCPRAQLCTPESRLEWMNASLPPAPRVFGAIPVTEVDGRRLSSETFDRDFFLPTKPVIIRGGANGAPALRWTMAQVVEAVAGSERSSSENQSEHLVDLCSIPYPEDWLPPDMLSAACRPGAVADAIKVVGEGPRYIFHEVEDGSPLSSLISRDLDFPALLPSVLGSPASTESILQFSLGQSGTGAPWHWHQDAFNVCVVGERIWYFRPPALALASNQSVEHGVPEASGSFYAVQRPGDIVYVPELWGHCVINSILSVAVAVEFGHVK